MPLSLKLHLALERIRNPNHALLFDIFEKFNNKTTNFAQL